MQELVDAIERGAVDVIVEAIVRDPALETRRTGDGDTLLHIACWQKRLEIVRLLARSDVNARGDLGRTPLHYAVQDGDARAVPIVRLLVERGADPLAKDDAGYTVIERARTEMWEALDEVLSLLGEPDPAVAIDADPAARVLAIERESHTRLVVWELAQCFIRGEPLSIETARAPRADQRVVDDARRILETIAATKLAEPIRAHLRASLTVADLERLLAVIEW